MFQKELGKKLFANIPLKNYGRLSILSKLRLKLKKNFSFSKLFSPKPKVTSMVIHLCQKIRILSKIKKFKKLRKNNKYSFFQ